MKSLIRFIKKIYTYRSVIVVMAIQEIQKMYLGTLVGFLWSIINPLMVILVYWFVFSFGLKVQPWGGVPFIVVFYCGLVPWLMFSNTLIANTNTIVNNGHLVKKMVFPTEILPVVNLTANLITHGLMLIILAIVLFFYNISFSLYNIQFLYYLFCLSIFTLGLSWLVSAINVFYRDTGQILNIAINMWFWLTPIVWGIEVLPENYRFFVMLNPMFYIVQGYKNSFIYHIPFWYDYSRGLFFWIVSLSLFVSGGAIFRKLKSEFADVL